MSFSLLNQNVCSFQNCGLHFQTLYDLVAHIEFAHIPLLEDENRKKNTATSASPEENRITVAPNLPLSCFQRVYPTPYRSTPCPLQPVKVSFNHYRRRQISVANLTNILPPQVNGLFLGMPKKEEDRHSSIEKEDADECAPNDPEMRYRCSWIDCGKRFKNSNALRQHMRNIHNASIGQEDVLQHHNSAVPSTSESSVVSSPTKYAQSRPHKCNQCSKRYKTTQGLQNHVTQAHQKLNGPNIDSNGPSPAALAQLILQKTTQSQSQQIGSDRSNYQHQNQRPQPPVSFSPQSNVMQNPHHASHLPVKSFPNHQNRPQQYPVQQTQTAGQILKQQISRQSLQLGQNLPHQQLGTNVMHHQQLGGHAMHHSEYSSLHQQQPDQRMMIEEADVRNRYPATIHQINNGEVPKQNLYVKEHGNVM